MPDSEQAGDRFDHICRDLEESNGETPGTFVGDYSHITDGNGEETDSPGNFVLDFPEKVEERESVPEEELGFVDSLLNYTSFGGTGLEIFYTTEGLQKDEDYVVEAVKYKAMKELSESRLGDTLVAFGMNFIAHKGMFPGSDITYGLIGAWEGWKSSRSDDGIDFQERCNNLYDEHIGVSGEDVRDWLEY